MAAQPSVLLGRTVVIIGSCTEVGLETVRRAKEAGARLIITDRHAGRLEEVADEVGVEATAAFDESDIEQLTVFLGRLPEPVDHVLFCGVDQPPICLARYARREMPASGSLVFAAAAVVPPALVTSLASEAAPVRVNLVTGTPGRPGDVAALAVRLMAEPVRTGAVVSPGRRNAGSGGS